jgi:hypothetical protein
MRACSSGDLYPFHSGSTSPPVAFTVLPSVTLWHRRLGHPDDHSLSKILSQFSVPIRCNKTHVCEACQLGRHVRLPFARSTTITSFPFQLIHCDLWTSPIASFTGFKYYLVILDDFSHYVWMFPLRHKSDTTTTFSNFLAYVYTQFFLGVQSLQCDNGKEFDNISLRTVLASRGVTLRFSCPYISAKK